MTTNRILTLGTPHLLRPVFLTGLVASLGFVPMAIATSAGSEYNARWLRSSSAD